MTGQLTIERSNGSSVAWGQSTENGVDFTEQEKIIDRMGLILRASQLARALHEFRDSLPVNTANPVFQEASAALDSGDLDKLAECGLELSWIWSTDIILDLIYKKEKLALCTILPNLLDVLNDDGSLKHDHRLSLELETSLLILKLFRKMHAGTKALLLGNSCEEKHAYEVSDPRLVFLWNDNSHTDTDLSKLRRFLERQGILNVEDEQDREYSIFARSSAKDYVAVLVSLLETSGQGAVHSFDNSVTFFPSAVSLRRMELTADEAIDVFYKGVPVIVDGKETLAAFQVATTVDVATKTLTPFGENAVWVTAVGAEHIQQQTHAFVLGTTIGAFTNDKYGDIHFCNTRTESAERQTSPEEATYLLAKLNDQILDNIKIALSSYSTLDAHEWVGYVVDNYEQFISEDRKWFLQLGAVFARELATIPDNIREGRTQSDLDQLLFTSSAEELKALGICFRSDLDIINVGTGASILGSLIAARFAGHKKLRLIEPGRPGQIALKKTIMSNGLSLEDYPLPWYKRANALHRAFPGVYVDCLSQFCAKATVEGGSFETLPEEAADIAMAEFAIGSVVTVPQTRAEARRQLRFLESSVKQGGLVVITVVHNAGDYKVGNSGHASARGLNFGRTKRMFEAAGFDIVHAEEFHPPLGSRTLVTSHDSLGLFVGRVNKQHQRARLSHFMH